MSESMTRGAPLMALQGTRMRHDVGTLSVNSELPVAVGKDHPVMVNPHIFAGLLDIGITAITVHKNALAITTQTGMEAKVPVIPDPHRVMELRLSEGGSEVEASLFVEWLNQSVAIGKAIGRHSGVVYTYRSNAFVFNSSVMIAARLSKGWPVQCTANPKLLANIIAQSAQDEVKRAICSDTEVLVKTASGTVLRAESAEDQLPQQPIEMLARFKAHTAPPLQVLNAGDLRDAAMQLSLISEAFGPSVANAEVHMTADAKGVTVKLLDSLVHFACEGWKLGNLNVPMRSFLTLRAIPVECNEAQIVASPTPGSQSPLVLRAGNLTFFMAAAAQGD
ncbi:hypothetical protein os4_36060 (plasmid) [Comamonadaceae bacterium OS-4]|nr:hypothetical protein os4_36060 [Comamonadaceae bacterium OS-4]